MRLTPILKNFQLKTWICSSKSPALTWSQNTNLWPTWLNSPKNFCKLTLHLKCSKSANKKHLWLKKTNKKQNKNQRPASKLHQQCRNRGNTMQAFTSPDSIVHTSAAAGIDSDPFLSFPRAHNPSNSLNCKCPRKTDSLKRHPAAAPPREKAQGDTLSVKTWH